MAVGGCHNPLWSSLTHHPPTDQLWCPMTQQTQQGSLLWHTHYRMTAIAWTFSLWRPLTIWTMLTNRGQWYCCWILILKESRVVNVTACVTTVRNSRAWEVLGKRYPFPSCWRYVLSFLRALYSFDVMRFNVTPLLTYDASQYDVAPLTMCVPFDMFSQLRKMRFESMIAGFPLRGEQRRCLLL